MKVIELAQEIFTSSLNSPTDIGVSNISFWLRENIGKLNNVIAKDFSVDANAQISPDLNNKEIAIFKLLYLLAYYDMQIRNSLGASSVNMTVEISDFGTTVRQVNRNELAKTWLQLRKAAKEELDGQVRDYNINQVKPMQVAGDDTTWSTNGGLTNSITDSSI